MAPNTDNDLLVPKELAKPKAKKPLLGRPPGSADRRKRRRRKQAANGRVPLSTIIRILKLAGKNTVSIEELESLCQLTADA